MNSQAEDTGTAPQRPLASWYVQGLTDGLGDRLLMFDNSGAPSLELLRFRPDLAQASEFEPALREQLRRLSRFEHASFSRIRAVQRLEPDDDLALISHAISGKRLSEVLHRTRGPAYAATLIKQLAPALAIFQEHAHGISHGLLNPDRIVVAPDGRLTIVEHVVGPAIATLDLSSVQLASVGIALPPGTDRIDVAADWYQLALVAVSVLLGRPIVSGDLPHLETLLDGVAHAARIDGGGLSPFVRGWLERALHISGERIETGADARDALDELLRSEWPADSRRVTLFRQDPVATASEPIEEAVVEPSVAAATATVATFTPRPAAPRAAGPTATHAAPSEPTHIEPTRIEPALPEPMPIEPPAEPPPLERYSFEPPPVVETQIEYLREEPARGGNRVASIFDLREAPRPKPAPPPVVQAPPEPPPRPAPAPPPAPAAARPRLLDFDAIPVYQQPAWTPPPVRSQPPVRTGVRTSIAAGLALIALIEAGAIAWMGRALWRLTRAAVTVESTATGEHVLVTHGPKLPAPLQVALAPDLKWIRTTSPPPDGILGMKLLKPATTGTVQITSPIALKVFEGSRVVGTVPGTDLRLTVGRHELDLVNEAFEFRLKQAFDLEGGQALAILVAPPYGWVTIDSTPSAEASIDGEPIGRTPLGPLPLAVGEHQITFRHQAGSSDRQRIVVKADQTVRVSGTLKF
jgi:hypothetical protein